MDDRDWTAQEARDRLELWRVGHDQRDQIVRKAHDAGLTKAEIWRQSGIARSTIDAILAERERQ